MIFFSVNVIFCRKICAMFNVVYLKKMNDFPQPRQSRHSENLQPEVKARPGTPYPLLSSRCQLVVAGLGIVSQLAHCAVVTALLLSSTFSSPFHSNSRHGSYFYNYFSCHRCVMYSVQIFAKDKYRQISLFEPYAMGMGIVIKVDIKFLTTASVFKTYPQLSVCFISIYDVVTSHKSMTSPSKAAEVPLWWLGGGTSEVQPPDRSHNGQDTRHPHQG